MAAKLAIRRDDVEILNGLGFRQEHISLLPKPLVVTFLDEKHTLEIGIDIPKHQTPEVVKGRFHARKRPCEVLDEQVAAA